MGEEERGGDLSKAKVSQLDKALQVYEDVLGLEVTVHDVVVVEVLQGQHNGGNVELGQVLIHPLQHLHLQPTPNHQQACCHASETVDSVKHKVN